MQSALHLIVGPAGIDIGLPKPLPIGRFLIGRPAEEAATLLPRLFNLCAMSQELAARMALGLPVAASATNRLTHDILREHLAKFFVFLPPLLDMRAAALPRGWESQPETLRCETLGCKGSVPDSLVGLKRWLARDEGLAPVIAEIAARFLPGEAVTPALPSAEGKDPFAPGVLENSLAGRHADHPLMQEIAAKFGRGPLWRAVARLIDLEACFEGRLPTPAAPAQGRALVPAARGTYAVSAETTEDGHVRAFARVTPTDHMLTRGGPLAQTLETLPPQRHDQLNLVMTLIDPCLPVRVSTKQPGAPTRSQTTYDTEAVHA